MLVYENVKLTFLIYKRKVEIEEISIYTDSDSHSIPFITCAVIEKSRVKAFLSLIENRILLGGDA